MDCAAVRMLAVDLIRGELAAELAPSVLRHLDECAACAETVEAMRATWAELDLVEADAPGPDLARPVLERVRRDLARPVLRLAWAPVLGTAAALLATALLALRMDLRWAWPTDLACCGGIWVAAYTIAFAAALTGLFGVRQRHRKAVLLGIAASGLALLLHLAVPLDVAAARVAAWASRAGAGSGSFFGASAAFTFLALLAAALLPALRQGRGWAAAATLLVLELPLLYLQCASPPLQALAPALAGAALGALAAAAPIGLGAAAAKAHP